MSRKSPFILTLLGTLMLFVLSGFLPVFLRSQTAPSVSAQDNVEYVCPMHPEVKSKTPGICPKCNMNLVAERKHAAPAKPSRWGKEYFPNVPLVTQDGKMVRFYDDLLKGKKVAINLIYTSCRDACPLETARLAQVQRMLDDRIGNDIFLYSISIDPKHDTPAVLKEYAAKYHAGPGWLFLTGKEEDIDLISRKMGLYSRDVGRDGHTPTLLLGDVATGQWVQQSAVDNARFLAVQMEQFFGAAPERKPVVSQSYASAKPVAIASAGQYLFASRCVVCHTIGHGDYIGPDLMGVTSRRERKWLKKFIATPDVMLSDGDPLAKALLAKYKDVQMPNLRLSDEDVNSLIDYLQSRGSGAQAPRSAPDQAVEPRPQR